MDPLLEATGTFALNLLKRLGEDNSKNVFYSPISISLALAMVLMGAKGTTTVQMAQALSVNKSSSSGGGDVHQGFQSLLTELNKMDTEYLLRTANRLFGEKSYDFLSNEEKPVQMMFKESTFKMTYIREICTKILVLPYVSEELNMIIMLPDEHIDLKTVEKELTYEKYIEWTSPDKMYKEEVEVFLPRFKLQENYDLEEVLRSLGMTDAFDKARADFSGMSLKRDLYLSKVVHKSFVEVNEEGTEAAAATACRIVLLCRPPCFCADHPFLFFIQHSRTRGILFCGRVSSP
ncbi:Hypothetical predicted protein [Marmota monax]|uniref:Serpin B6 n=1 Tax=Marmota monax TaxID=9995 RepID=A0A5E4BEY5_MARMO|nr:Hypothetical predicted protein [Marmota monax]